MRRVLAVCVALCALAAPALAHPEDYEDGTLDSYQAGDQDTKPYLTPFDIAEAKFTETKNSYKMKVTFHESPDPALLCSRASCTEAEISNLGFIGSDFYRWVNNVRKKVYIVQIGVDEVGAITGELLKLTDDGLEFKTEITPTLTDDTLRYAVPRDRLKGHTKGRVIRWNAYSVVWHSQTGFCEYDDAVVEFSAGCVDWVPEEQDAKHTLRT